MAELTPDARELLKRLQALDDPTPAERARGDAAVREALASHGMRDLPPLPPLSAATKSATLATSWSFGMLKLLWGLGAVAIVALGTVAWPALRSPQAELRPSVATSTPQAPHAAVPFAPAAPVVPAESAPQPAPKPLPASRTPPPRVLRKKPAEQSSLGEELRLLSSVDAEIRDGRYQHALQRLAKSKGSAQLREERAALRVLALCGRDSGRQAARARDQFLQSAPNSVLAARVRAACAAELEP